MSSLLVLLSIVKDVLDSLIDDVLGVTIETLTIIQGGRLESLSGLNKLGSRVLLEELLSFNLKEVRIADFLIGTTMLLLNRSGLMGFHNISFTSLYTFFEQYLCLLCLFQSLIIYSSTSLMLNPQLLKLLLKPVNMLHEIH